MLQQFLISWFLLLCPATRALLFGTTGRKGTNSRLYRISTTKTASGILTGFDLGEIRVQNKGVTVSGLAFDRSNRILGGKMYGVVDQSSNNFPNYLIEIDLATAIGIPVTQLSFTGAAGLAISNSADIYSWHKGSVPGDPDDVLLKVDPSGSASAAGPSDPELNTFFPASESSFGMDFDRRNDLQIHFLTSNCTYFTVQTANGDAEYIGRISSVDSSFYCGNAAFNPDSPPGVTELWSLEVDIRAGSNANTQIAVIDLNSLQLIGTSLTNIDDLQTIAFTYDTTLMPSSQPSGQPSESPSGSPSAFPSVEPTSYPSMSPSGSPSAFPSVEPTSYPSVSPTKSLRPSASPSRNPSGSPSLSQAPSSSPSSSPSGHPSGSPTEAPSPAPSSNTTTIPEECFSKVNTVEVRGRGKIPIRALEIGDYVRDGQEESFSRVYSLGHNDHKTRIEYLQIFAGLDRPLEVTRHHFVIANATMVMASDVKVGNVLAGNHTVTKIRSITRHGKYAPLTESGYIQVSGIVASNYAVLLNVPPQLLHTTFHALLAPVRWVCTVNFDVCARETYTNGDSDWGYYALPLLSKFRSFGTPVQVFAIILLAPLVAAFTYPLLTLALVCMIVAWIRKRQPVKGKSL